METAQTIGQELINEFVGVAHGDLARFKKLLADHPELANVTATWGETPIEAAAQMRQREMIEMLLEAGAPLDICTAAVMGWADQVEAFLQADPAQINATGAHGIPLMYYPVIGGHKEIAEMLRARGADIDAGEGVSTPLHGAALFGETEMAKWLMAHVANPTAKDYAGKTPLQVAKENGHDSIVELLRSDTGAE